MEVIIQHIGCLLVASMRTLAVLTFLFGVCSGLVNADYLYNSDGYENSRDYDFRPCITLNSNVQVTSGEGSSSSPFKIK